MESISSLSTVHVYSFIKGATGGEPSVEIAFTASPSTEPAEPDWHDAEWGSPTSDGCPARILIGPGPGGLNLGDGTHSMWIRVTGTTEIPVFYAGLVPIT